MPATEGRLGGPTGLHHLNEDHLDDGAGRNGLVAEHHHNAAARRKERGGSGHRHRVGTWRSVAHSGSGCLWYSTGCDAVASSAAAKNG